MAVTAKFLADFSSFDDAVKGAEIELKSFETSASRVESSLSRMTDSFSGRKMIQDATLMAEAVERIGGTSKLTEKELERLGTTSKAAVEKMKALGLEVPANLQKIADETKTATTAQEGLGDAVKSAALAFTALFSIRAVTSFVSDIVESAGALTDLSAQTRISVEDLQVMGGAMSEFGVDADQMGRALFGLSSKIAGGDESVAKALETMGLSLEEVRGLEGEELFLTIEKGLAKLQGGLRDTTAATIYGEKLGAVMAGASTDIEGTIATWREMNTVMSTETAEALDAANENIVRMQANLTALAANMAGPVAEGFNTLFENANKGLSKWAILLSFLPEGLGGVSVSTSQLADMIAKLDEKTQGANTTTQAMGPFLNQARDAAVQYGPFLEEAGNSAKWLAEQQKEAAVQAAVLAGAMKAHGDAIGAIIDDIFGVKALQAATDWSDAMLVIGDSIGMLTSTQLEKLQESMLQGIDALAKTGQLTGEQAQRFSELAIAAQQALEALKPVVTVNEDLARSQWEYVTALDAALASTIKLRDEANKKAADDEARDKKKKEAASAGAGVGLGIATTTGGVSVDQYGRPTINAFSGVGLSSLSRVTTVNVYGSVMTADDMARQVGDAVSGNYRRGGNRVPV